MAATRARGRPASINLEGRTAHPCGAEQLTYLVKTIAGADARGTVSPMSTVSFSKSSPKSGARFVQSRKGTNVKVARDGGVRVGPSHCVAKRKHFSTSYGKSGY
jgi:hypothetical protein